MRKVLLAFIALPVFGACVASMGPAPGGPPPPPPEHRVERPREPRIIEGTLRDAITHQPIDRAAIDITGHGIREMTIQTGPDGRFQTGEIPRGEFAIRVRREGYETYTSSATMSDGIARLEFDL